MKAFILLMVVVCVGCGKKATPDASANKLFVEAVKLIGSAEEELIASAKAQGVKTSRRPDDRQAAAKGYEQGLAKIQTIIDNYSESDLAVKLISGETLIAGKSLKEIKERHKDLKDARLSFGLRPQEGSGKRRAHPLFGIGGDK